MGIKKTKVSSEASTRKCENSVKEINFETRAELVNRLLYSNDSKQMASTRTKGNMTTK